MSDQFDPYYVWLGIPPAEQPPDLYRLLGTSRYEADQGVIENAADQRMLHLRTFQSGKNGAVSQKVLNEVSQAKIVLLQPDQKAAYDAKLRAADAKLREAAARPEPPRIPAAHETHRPAVSPVFVRQAEKPVKKPTPGWLVPAIIGGVTLFALTGVAVVAAMIILPGSRDSDSTGTEPVDPKTGIAKVDSQKTVDLIKEGPDHGTVVGGTIQWEDGDIKIGSSEKVNSRYVFHRELPEKFQVRLKVTRHELLSGLSLGFPVGETRGHIVVDRDLEESRFSGMELVNRRRCSDSAYVGAHRGVVLPVGQQVELRIQVEPGRVILVADDQTIHVWEGTADQLSAESWRKVPDEHASCLSLQSWNSKFTIHELAIVAEFEPADLAVGNSSVGNSGVGNNIFGEQADGHDLLEELDLDEQTIEGQTQFKDGVLKLVGGKRVAIEIADSLPSSCELEMNVTRFDGVDELVIGLVVGGQKTHLIIDRKLKNGLRTGIGIARNRSLGYSGYTGGKQGRVLPLGTPVQLRISVGENLELYADGKMIYSIQATEQMSQTRDYRHKTSADSSIYLACTRSSFDINSLSIRSTETN